MSILFVCSANNVQQNISQPDFVHNLNFFYFFIKGQPNIITLQFYLGSKTIGKHGMWVVRSSYTTHMERSGDSGQGTLE